MSENLYQLDGKRVIRINKIVAKGEPYPKKELQYEERASGNFSIHSSDKDLANIFKEIKEIIKSKSK